MIRYLEYKDIDKTRWDDCIKKSFNGNVYAYSWYLDIVAENWDGLIEDDYERVFPLTMGKKFGINYLYQPFFTQQLGVFSKNILTQDVVLQFLEAIPSKFKFVEILLNSYNRVASEKFELSPQVNHELDLIKPYDSLVKSFSKNTRRNINKAKNEGLTILDNIKPETLIELFRENRGRNITHLKDNNYKRLHRLMHSGIYKGIAGIYGAFTKENVLCGGVYFIKSNRKAVFLFSGLSDEGKKAGAMPLLINFFIEKNAVSHLTLDFDGSNDPNLARFYKSFGAKQTTYLKLLINNLPWYLDKTMRIVKQKKSV